MMEFARVPEQVKTCESTREKQTSVITDGNRRKRKKTSARFSAVMEFARVPEQVKTCESTHVKRTSVITDENRRE